MNSKILVVDDETDLLELLDMNLSQEGFIVRTAASGADAMAMVRADKPELILLDIMLGDISGIQLTSKMKTDPETADIPIILLTAKDKDTDVVVGLSVGADDYITKPFSTPVLVARIEALLRRAQTTKNIDSQTLSIGPVKIVPSAREVIANGKSVDLTSGEYEILMALVKAAGSILSRKQLKEELGESAKGQRTRIVDVHVASIRKKLGLAKNIIKTVYARGYRIVL